MPDFVSLGKKALVIAGVIAVGLIALKLAAKLPVVGPWAAKLDV